MLKLGAFTITEPLGTGGMAEVWSGVHEDTGLRVAVKLLASGNTTDSRYRRVFRREVEAVAALDHPFVVMVFDHGMTPANTKSQTDGAIGNDVPYLVMEYASGGALDEDAPTQWTDIRHTLLCILDGLAHAHARGVIHRDLKPANVLTCGPEDLRPGIKLADFGLAHRILTGKAMAAGAGTPTYMAPEQVKGDWRAFGPWTDLYAVGILAWEWVTGAPPFPGEDPATILNAQLHQPLPPFEPRVEVPEELAPWLRALLHKDPDTRCPHAAAATRELLALSQPAPTRSGPIRQTGQRPVTLFTLIPDLSDVDASEVPGAPPVARTSGPTAPIPSSWKAPSTMRPPRGVANAGIGLIGVRPPPFLGRIAERNHLWTVLTEVVDQDRIRGVLVRGPDGIGKTRLAHWLGCRAQELGIAHVWSIRYGPDFEASTPLSDLERMLDEPGGAPLIAVIDDVQWAASARRLARKVLEMAPFVSRPLLVLLVTGAADEAVQGELDAIEALDAVSTIALGPLDRNDTDNLVTHVLGVDLSVAAQVRRTSMGNPMVAIEILRGWASQGDLVPREHGFTLRDSATLPKNLSALWEDRLAPHVAPLPTPERHALLLAAILGTRVREVEWAAGCKRAGLPLPLEVAASWIRAGFLEPWESGFQWRQETARESLISRARAEGLYTHLNWVCADLLRARGGNAERIGHHLAASGAFEQAFDPLMAGARLQVDEDDYRRALGLVERAERCLEQAAIPAQDPRYARAMIGRVLCLINLWELERAVATGTRFLADLAPETEHAAAELQSLLGLSCYRLGRLEDAERWLSLAAGDHRPPSLQLRVIRGLGQLAQSRGQLDEAEAQFRHTSRLAEAHGTPFQLACAYNDLSVIADLRGDVETATQLVRRGLAICEEHGFRDATTARLNLCGHLLTQGAYREALRAIEEVVDSPELAWSPIARVMAQAYVVTIHTALGQWEAWEASRRELGALLRYQAWAEHTLATLMTKASSEAAEAGELDRARDLASIALEQCERLGLDDEAASLRTRMRAW